MTVTYLEIEEVIIEINKDIDSYEKKFAEEQNLYLELLQTQVFPLLEKANRELILFINTVIYFALSKKINDFDFDIEAYLEAEELNWGTKEKSKDWVQCLDNFFSAYPEEDLLAFVEDMTAGDEENEINISDIEVIFITSKSYIDQYSLNLV